MPVMYVDGNEMTVYGKVTFVSHYYDNVYIANIRAAGLRTNVSVFFEGDVLVPGDRVKALGVVKSTVNKAEEDWLTTWYKSENNLLEMRSSEILDISHGKAPLVFVMAQWRENIAKLIPAGLPRALLFSDRTALSAADVSAFERVGLAHMLSFSGSHFMILTLAVRTILSFVGVDRRKAAFATLLFVLFIIVFMGFRVFVVRSGLMAVIVNLGILLGRRSDSLTSLFTAAFLICLFAPYAVESTSLLLSFSSVLGIILLADAFTGKADSKLLQMLFSAVGVTISATLGSAVSTLLIFGQLPLLSLPANVLTLWPMSVIIMLGPLSGGFVGTALQNYCMLVIRALAAVPNTLIYSRDTAVWIVLASFSVIFFCASIIKSVLQKVLVLQCPPLS